MFENIEERFWDKIHTEPNSGCWLWMGAEDLKGYGQFWFNGRARRAHRISWMLHKGQIPINICVLHKCDTKLCVNPEHLFLGTHKDNVHDMYQKGREADNRGELHPQAKLANEQVLEIRELLANTDMPQKEIAELYDVCRTTIYEIRTGRSWSHI